MGAYGMTHANSVTIHNLTGCGFTLNFGTFGGYAPPGVSSFTAPTADLIVACKIIYPGATYISIGVGLPPDFPPYANSAMYSNNPSCLSSSFYTCSWSQTSSVANATLVIF